jgi:trehalose/maltose hydrolase-like predicted phosphorylase
MFDHPLEQPMTPNPFISADDESDPAWAVVEQDLDLEKISLNETLFALGNGYLGMRGTFEEGLGHSALEGTYINGFYESAPIVYGEKFIGYAENKQTILNLPNAKLIRIDLAGEPFNLLTGKILAYRRWLDFRQGILHRRVIWESPQGRQVQVEVQRLVLHTRRHLALIRFRFTPLNFDGPIMLTSLIDGAVRQSEHAEDDPRLGTQFKGEVLRLEREEFAADLAMIQHRTVTTQFAVGCGIRNSLDTLAICQPYSSEKSIGFVYQIEGSRGVPITLDKFMAYATSLDSEAGQVLPAVLVELNEAARVGFDALCLEQIDYMRDFWDAADIEIEGDHLLQRGIRFNMFHLLQGAGKDGRTNIAAKGLTGLGYEGHYFWDTEVYMLPFFLYTRPEMSRKLLEYRFNILDKARERARQMSHPRGALYSWRSINGEECSANFPTGTAQYHINADIAFAIHRYWDATLDFEFMKEYGAEILCETARLWLDVGVYMPSKGGRFCINSVTGPDEYQILVNNNAYTNLMAAENLRFACQTLDLLQTTDPTAYRQLARKIDLQPEEPAAWAKAAETMYVPYDEERGIIPQDDAFLGKPAWDFAHTPRENYPLLLHYHPLVVMRYQVCKQADTLLAEYLLHDRFDRAQKERDFAFYEPLTTHDSSLSGAVFGILAAELGDTEKAYRYFAETATLDLENKHGNTEAGIHAANMAGTWQGIVFGFAGMRAKDGLSFNPIIPQYWEAYAFKVRYRGRLIGVRVTKAGAEIKLLNGEPLEISVGGGRRMLGA